MRGSNFFLLVRNFLYWESNFSKGEEMMNKVAQLLLVHMSKLWKILLK